MTVGIVRICIKEMREDMSYSMYVCKSHAGPQHRLEKRIQAQLERQFEFEIIERARP